MLMRLPVDETSFELGIQSQAPGKYRRLIVNSDAHVFSIFYLEYLDEMAPKTNYVSEFGHLTRITALFSQMEDAVCELTAFDFRSFGSVFDKFEFIWVAIVDDNDRFVSAMQEAKKALKVLSSCTHLLFVERY
jgi:hypothetical protein